MLEITILPSGHLRCRVPADGTDSYALERVAAVFARAGEGAGLVALAGLRTLEGLSMGAMFWRDFAGRFLRAFAALAPEADALLAAGDGGADDGAVAGATPPPPPPETLQILLSAPPMLGAEYLTVSAFDGRWRAMDVWARERSAELGGAAAFFLAHAPQCPVAGKVCFHLAERREESQPFALLTSYAAGADRGGAPVRVRLTAALAEKAPAAMEALRRAAAGSAVLAPLLASGRLFAPVPLSPDEAYAFLRETPRYEAAGVKVQVPDWWHERPLAQVTFSLGNASQERFTGDALLDCEVGLSVGGKALSPADAAALLAGGSGLRQIYGQWVEVDAEKLREVMGHWQRVKEKAGEGLTFGAAMRLLAGAGDGEDAEDDEAAEATRRWSFVTAGERLRGFLDRIRPPAPARDGGARGDGDGDGDAAGPGRQKPLRFGGGLKADLRPYQEQGVRWLALLTRLGLGACLADDMGLGKTLQTIALLVWQKRRHERRRAKGGRPLRPTLLVAPASLLGNWRAELARFAPGLECRFAHPAFCRRPLAEVGERAGAWLEGADVVVTTYAQLARLSWLQRRRWQLVVLDEAQAIKNPASRQARAVKALRARARVALTGTPVENRLGDLWSLFDFLNPGLLGSSHEFQAWAARMRHGGEGFAPLRRLVAPYILRRLKTDRAVISDLPDKVEVDAWCALSERQERLYRDHVERLARELEHCDAIARRGLVLAYLMRFKQICNHPAQFAGESFFAPEDSGKFLRLREIAVKAASRQEKMLIFTQFREMASPLAAFLRTIYGEEGLVLHGGTPAAERARRVDAFQREDGPPFFVLSLKAGGAGLNLTAAAQVVHFDRWWNPAVENQATDRAYRIGQRRNVVVHKFVCGGTLEEKINALLRDKAAMAGELLGDGEGAPPALTELDNAELLRLVSFDLAAAAREE